MSIQVTLPIFPLWRPETGGTGYGNTVTTHPSAFSPLYCISSTLATPGSQAPSLPYLTFLVLSWFSLPLIVSYSASFIVNLIHHCLSSLYICPFVLCQYSVVVWRILSVVRSVPVVILVHSGSHIITQISGHCRPTSSSALQCSVSTSPVATPHSVLTFLQMTYFLFGSLWNKEFREFFCFFCYFLLRLVGR